MVDEERLAAARKMVEKVLRGEITPETHASLFSDDIVYMNVNIVEQADLGWLMAQLAKRDYTREARLCVARNMSGPSQERALALAEGKAQ